MDCPFPLANCACSISYLILYRNERAAPVISDLYIGAAGIKPNTTVPICLDLGTNTGKFLDDPLYIGVRRKRPQTVEVCCSS